jgi:hypothetical protein
VGLAVTGPFPLFNGLPLAAPGQAQNGTGGSLWGPLFGKNLMYKMEILNGVAVDTLKLKHYVKYRAI